MVEIINWLKRIGSPDALEKRRTERMEGNLNAPIRRRLPASHKLTCLCERCFPPGMEAGRAMMVLAREGKLPKSSWKEPVPVVVRHRKRKKSKKKAGKWVNRGTSSN